MFAAPIGFWIGRNSLIANRPVGLTAGMGVVLYESAMQYSGRISYRRTISEWEVIHAGEHSLERAVDRATLPGDWSHAPRNIRYELAIDRKFRDEAVQMLYRDGMPQPFTNLLQRMSYLWAPSDLFEGWPHAIARGENVAFVGLVAIGGWLLRKRPRIVLLLFLPALYTAALHLVFQVEGRYSIPARLPLMIVAGYALAWLCRKEPEMSTQSEWQATSEFQGKAREIPG
jgi:hypothetical protein